MICPDCGMQFEPEHSCYCGYRPKYVDHIRLYSTSTRSFADGIIPSQVDAKKAVDNYSLAYPNLINPKQD